MPTPDQQKVFIQYLIFGLCIAMFAIGVTLVVIWVLNRKAGPSRRVSRHRKGARFHKPTYIPVEVQPHPYEPIAFLQAHVRRTTSVELLSTTKVMPKINVEVNHAAIRQ